MKPLRELGTPTEWIGDCVIAVLLVAFFAWVLPVSIVMAKATAEQVMEQQP